MDELEMKSRVYALIDEQNRVTRIEGEYTLPNDLDGWTLIEEGEPCDRLNLAQSHYLEKPLMTMDGIYQYKYENETVLERTEEEMETDRAEIEPTESEEAFTLEYLADIEERLSLIELGL